MKKLIVGTLVGASLAAAAAPLLLAQSATSSTDKPQAERFAHRHGHGKRAFRMPSERIEARLAYLKAALKINQPGTLHALSYCNIHGLWESKKEIGLA